MTIVIFGEDERPIRHHSNVSKVHIYAHSDCFLDTTIEGDSFVRVSDESKDSPKYNETPTVGFAVRVK